MMVRRPVRSRALPMVGMAAVMVAGGLLLGGGPAGAAKAAAPVTHTFVLKTTAEPIKNLTPVQNVTPCNPHSLADIYDHLVRSTQTGKFVPGLAKSWASSNGGKTFTMILQSGVKFQDGTPFNAAAVADAIKRGKTTPKSTLKATLKTIATVTTPNTTTVVVNLTNPVAGIMPDTFNGFAGEIPSPTAVAKYGAAYGVTIAVGAGPYQPVAFKPNTSLTLTAFKTYWTKTAQTFAGVQLNGMASTTTALFAAKVSKGTWNMVSVKDSDIPTVDATSGVRYVEAPSRQYPNILLNSSVAPWNTLKVRQAAEYAINRAALVQVMTTGLDKPATQPLPPGEPGHTPSLKKLYPYSPSKAKKLLSEAGHANGLAVTVGEIAFSYYEKMATAVKSMLDAVGFQVTLTPFPATQVNAILHTQKRYAAAVTAFLAPIPGTWGTLYTAFGTGGAANISGPASAGIDSNLAKAAKSTTATVQKTALRAVSKIVMTTALQVPLYYNDGVNVYALNIKNDSFGQTQCEASDLTESPYIYAAKAS